MCSVRRQVPLEAFGLVFLCTLVVGEDCPYLAGRGPNLTVHLFLFPSLGLQMGYPVTRFGVYRVQLGRAWGGMVSGRGLFSQHWLVPYLQLSTLFYCFSSVLNADSYFQKLFHFKIIIYVYMNVYMKYICIYIHIYECFAYMYAHLICAGCL